jgi:hypothetical protein
MVFERRHPKTFRHVQQNGYFICNATNAYKFRFICLFEQNKAQHYYLFCFYNLLEWQHRMGLLYILMCYINE